MENSIWLDGALAAIALLILGSGLVLLIQGVTAMNRKS
ncbi:MAG: NAD synthetase [Cyanobacteria bacterium P01_A01_bin.123]